MNGSHTLFTTSGTLAPLRTKSDEKESRNPVTPIVEFAVVPDPDDEASKTVIKVSTSRGFGARKNSKNGNKDAKKVLRKDRVGKKKPKQAIPKSDEAGDKIVVQNNQNDVEERDVSSENSRLVEEDTANTEEKDNMNRDHAMSSVNEAGNSTFSDSIKKFSNLF